MAATDIRSLDIAMLRTFEALLAERSVSRAAGRLFLSQSAVSSTLKRLRDLFDDPLFTRTAHGVEPTARALILAPHVHSALYEITRLLSAGQEFDPANSDRIFRVQSSDHMSQLILPTLCSELAAMNSGIRLLWEPANAASQAALQRGDADIGFLPRFVPPAGVAAEGLYEDHYVLGARPGRWPAGSPVTLQQFCAAPQVILGYGRSTIEDLVDQTVAKAKLRRYPQVALTSFAQIIDLVAHSDHAAILPARVARRYASSVEIYALPLEIPSYTLYLCTPLRAEVDLGTQWMCATMRRIVLGNYPAGSGAA